VDPAVRTVWSQLETADATLAVEGDATVKADPDRLQQLLMNLFRNAVEHGGEGVSVRVAVERLNGTVRIAVEDDGPGIPADERTRVFERGVSLGGGTGLGLAIVGDIVEAHGWSVAAEDAAGGGARFVIDDIVAARGDDEAADPPSGRTEVTDPPSEGDPEVTDAPAGTDPT